MRSTQHFCPGADVALSVHRWRARSQHERQLPVLILHGMRDVAQAFDPIAAHLSARYEVLVPDLRGHGDSEKSDAYSLVHFIADVLRVLDHFEIAAAHIVGHSLGGHVAAQFAALFPNRTHSLCAIEGLGPPTVPNTRIAPSDTLARLRTAVEQVGRHPAHRALRDLTEASARLQANNPRLSDSEAARLATHATTLAQNGDLVWKFDPRAQDVWGTFDHGANAERCRSIAAPTLIITGSLAMEYWLGMRRGDERPIPAYPAAELMAKVAVFPNATHRQIDDAGHMIHYDQPALLSKLIEEFLLTVPTT